MPIIEFLANLLQTDPAVVVIGLVVIVIIIAFKIAGLTRKGPEYTYSGNRAVDAINKALADFKFIEDMTNIGKRIFKDMAQRIIEGKGGFQDILVIFIFVVIIVWVGFSAADHYGAIKIEPDVVGQNETCVRNGEELAEGTKIQVGDKCNGRTIEPTAVQPTIAATQTLPPPSPTTQGPTQEAVQQHASATPAPTEQPGKLIKVVWLDGHPAEQGWMKVPSLDGYRQAGEKTKCKIYNTKALEIPEGATFAFVLFEGGTLVSDSLVNLSDTKLTLSQKNVEISYCKPGSWFSLWVK